MIRGRKRPLEKAPEVNANLNCSIHNRFDIEVIDAATGKIKQMAQAENVICNTLWTKLLTPATYFNYIHYGTGSGTPAAANTSLFTFLGHGTPTTADDVYSLSTSTGVASLRRKITLSETTAVGSTLTEVGIGYSTTAATLVTHAMLKDMNGNQISIIKTNTDIINIYATVFAHWNTSGENSGYIHVIPHLLQTGTAQGFFRMILGMYEATYSNPPYAAQLIDGCIIAKASSFPAVNISRAYSSANKQITCTMSRLGASDYNVGGALFICLYSGPSLTAPCMILEVGGGWYSGTTITSEAIGTGDGTTTDFATAFPYPKSATVYIDGVAQSSGVTVSDIPLLKSDMGQYFIGLHADSTPAQHIMYPNPAPSDVRVSDSSFPSGGSVIYYNPNYLIGIASLHQYNCAVAVSDDLSTWTTIAATGIGTISVASAYQNSKYWKFTATTDTWRFVQALTAPTSFAGKPIHFDTAPTSGAVITADYTTKTIAKDANHVFDLTVTIQLGEHVT